ncbi:MAG TPA: PGF-pre-PGF domain-containing protein, partial [Candidatus Nanoarchaeia archaeon]|nr:PGF-pre-PGF domain-containing protein [Candidatus Nanoarchaeia archaeon]
HVVNVAKDAISVEQVRITVDSALSNAEVKVASLGSKKPDTLPAPAGAAYQFLEISRKNIEEKNLKEATITFKVPGSWLEKEEVGEDEVLLQRYTSAWEELETRKTKNVGSTVFYEADTPGFSYFVVTGRVKAAAQGAEVNATTAATAVGGNESEELGTEAAIALTQPIKKDPLVMIVPVVLIVLIGAGVLIVALGRRKK